MIQNRRISIEPRSWRAQVLLKKRTEVCIRFAKEALVIPSASERLCKASFHGWPRSRARASYAEHTASSCFSAIEREFQQNPLIGIHQSPCDASRQVTVLNGIVRERDEPFETSERITRSEASTRSNAEKPETDPHDRNGKMAIAWTNDADFHGVTCLR